MQLSCSNDNNKDGNNSSNNLNIYNNTSKEDSSDFNINDDKNRSNSNINSSNTYNDGIGSDDNIKFDGILISFLDFHFRFEFTPFEYQSKNCSEFQDVHFFPESYSSPRQFIQVYFTIIHSKAKHGMVNNFG